MLRAEGGCAVEDDYVDPLKSFTIHGVLMWVSWTVIALLQVVFNRYLTHYWRFRQTVHTTLGIISALLTLGAGTLILQVSGWTIVWD